ncbi:accessory gene regulator AgrB [Staphylococcus succinus]|uniref:Accessory gene regulator protein B n=1 Tax=Staphylococcus succinus TaxID=61015 RepID=A0A9Q6MWD0_9STAP|nr:accessory gene regulator AgrB [Staphylococcus succinus]MEB8128011.1 accessory gene regulator AgrB [Staphylococcus succinus]MEB8211246.1 accessory gene regulator AgrB [Staphylococcus succinus]PTI67218.1 accessory regulator AgrB [Staphylococcus succinus]PTI77109.1 accessory regulator AgrB [Staphylococcus succinus]RIN28056.1 accessory regulator AgrB [Staphylococcus succinus]
MSKLIDNKIDKFSKYLQQRNNLEHIEYLKMRLGMQVVVSNFFKALVTYGVSILCHLFLYTLTVHLSYFFIRLYAHGAHAKSSLLCHMQNLLFFVLLPWLLGYMNVSSLFMYSLAIIGFVVLVIYAPAETKKQPIPIRLKKRKKEKTIVVTLLLLIISVFFKDSYQQLILLGIVLIAGTQLPIFFPKEDVKS